MSLPSVKLSQFMRPEDLPKCHVDLQPLKQIFLLKKTQKINQQNLLIVTQLKHLADLSHTFIGLTRCFTFETLRLPHNIFRPEGV